MTSGPGTAADAPAIRLAPTNQVPACVTPDRLDRFLRDQIRARGYQLHPGHENIAVHYRRHGEKHRVRWDYAFFQMALETNFLSFRRANGKRGDVLPNQNNFAGLGTTGRGVPGDSYPDASTGVLAQIQHLVVYSGERLADPVGHRTRLKQDVILRSIEKISRKRPVTFADLARRWAADRHYGRSIKRLAQLFFADYCQGSARETAISTSALAVPLPAKPMAAAQQTVKSPPIAAPLPTPVQPAPTGQAMATAGAATANGPRDCDIMVASYGGDRTVLIESVAGDIVKLTALGVQPGFEAAMAEEFIRSYAPAGRTLGAFPSRNLAIAKAQEVCRKRLARR